MALGGFVILVKDASHPQIFCDLDEHCCVVDKGDLLSRRLGKVKGETKDIDIWLAHANKAGRNEGIRQLVQLERANAVRIDRARFIADHDDLQTMPLLESSDEFDHPGERLRLSEHEVPKLVPRECFAFHKRPPSQGIPEK